MPRRKKLPSLTVTARLGDIKVKSAKITIEPINDGMLPGMGPELLLGGPTVDVEAKG